MATIDERVDNAVVSIDRALRMLNMMPEPSQPDIEALEEIRTGLELVPTLPQETQIKTFNNYIERLSEIADRLIGKEAMN